MAKVLQSAAEAGQASVRVQSTVTALGFYTRLDFVAVWDHWHGDERTIIMTRDVRSGRTATHGNARAAW